jgi:hypothetical protein
MRGHALFPGGFAAVMAVAVAAAALSPVMFASAGAGAAAAAGAGAAAGGGWGRAEEVPGLAALTKGGAAAVTSMSCASAGNCSAAGEYSDRSGRDQLFIQVFAVSQKNGRWGKAEQIPGTAVLNKGDYAQVTKVSCASAGNCSLVGNYSKRSGFEGMFVVSQKNGRWGKAEPVPGIPAVAGDDASEIDSVSCGAAGSCSAGGTYLARSGNTEAFVISEKNGRWGKAEQVPGIAALNTGGAAEINSVSCASAGNCTAGGEYGTRGDVNNRPSEAFVTVQKNGTWSKARQIPGLAALDTGHQSQINSVSCARPGNCTAGGSYAERSGNSPAIVAAQKNGTWTKAEQVPGLAALSKAGYADIDSVSCASPGNCTAGGHYATSTGFRPFVVTQKNGTWGKARQIPGLAALDTGRESAIGPVSCASAGNCSAGGNYSRHRPGNNRAFVTTQHNGTWGHAEQVPGIAALSKDHDSSTDTVSCPPAGNCSAGGGYIDSTGRHVQAFVVSQAP